VAKLNIQKLKKIEGGIYELQRVNKTDIEKYKEDCKNNILRINQSIEELEIKRSVYEKEIIIANGLLEK